MPQRQEVGFWSLSLGKVVHSGKYAKNNNAVTDTAGIHPELLDIVTSNTEACLVYLDRDFNFVWVNDAYARLSGRAKNEFIGHNHFDLYPDEENEAILQQVRDTGEPFNIEAKPFVYPDQPERGITYWNWTLTPIKDKTGLVQGLVFSLVDVTKRKVAEDALRESEERVRRKINSILSPEADIGQLELADILDVEAIQSVMESFYKLAPIPMAIIDLNGKVLVGIGWQDICTKFHRVNPDTCAYCIESDTELTAGVQPGEFRLYKCKNNMWDVATPIMIGNKHVGNLFSGQFFFDDEAPDYAFFRKQAMHYGFNEEEYISALDRVPRFSRQTVNEGMKFFIGLADMISKLSYSNIELARLLAERDILTSSLRESEERYRTLFTSMSEGFALHEMIFNDSGKPCDYRFLEINSAFERQTGLKRRNVIGKTIREINPDIEQKWIETFGQVALTGKPVRLERYNEESGTYHEVVVFRPSDGRVAAFILDITDRKKAETELKQAREESEQNAAQLQSILSSMADGVSLADPEGRIVFMNEAGLRIMGVPAEEALEYWLFTHKRYTLDGKLIPVEQTATARALRGESVRDVQYRLVLPWGKDMIIGFSSSPVRNAEGKIIGATTVFHDETEKVEFEKRKEEFFRREHRIAETLQNALVPPELPKILQGCRIASVYEPASDEAEVGGDFYDVFEIDDNRIGILIGDIAGKGLQAAIGVASARYAIRAYAYANSSPAEVLRLSNNALCSEELQGVGMLTAIFAVIDRSKHTFAYASAGHVPPVLRSADGKVKELETMGLPLSVIRDFEYTETIYDLRPGDVLIAMTDGITEARKSSTNMFESKGVLAFLAGGAARTVQDIATGLVAAAKAHAGGKLQDDAAVLVIEPLPLDLAIEQSLELSDDDKVGAVKTRAVGCGSLTRSTDLSFLQRLERLKKSSDTAVVDLRRATFVDSGILSALADAAVAMLERGRRLQILVADESYPLRILHLIRFDDITDIKVEPNTCPEEDWKLLEEQTIELRSRADDLERCRQAAFNVAMTLGFSRAQSWDITTACVEACANAIEHGNKGSNNPVEVIVRALPDRFEAKIKDHGKGFCCPAELPIPPPTSRRGRGLPLMKLIMDEVTFKCDDGCEVGLVKYVENKENESLR